MREETGLLPGTEVEFVVRGDNVLIRKERDSRRRRRLVDAPAGKGGISMSTDRIMALTRGGRCASWNIVLEIFHKDIQNVKDKNFILNILYIPVD